MAHQGDDQNSGHKVVFHIFVFGVLGVFCGLEQILDLPVEIPVGI